MRQEDKLEGMLGYVALVDVVVDDGVIVEGGV